MPRMRTHLHKLLLAGATTVALALPLRGQTVQTFEGLSTTVCPFQVQVGQAAVGQLSDITFQGNWLCFTQPTTLFNPKSGVARVFPVDNTGDVIASASFKFDAPVTFGGAWFAGYSTVNYLLSYLGNTVGPSNSLSLTSTPTYLASGYAGLVDRVTVTGSVVTQGQIADAWVMDDVTYTVPTTTVPEPGAFSLASAGLLIIGGLAFQQRRKK